MTPDDDMLMAYADGELDPIAAKRVERAIAADAALAEAVERHRALRRHISTAYAPVLDAPVPDRLAAMLATNVVPLAPRIAAGRHSQRWSVGIAAAASLFVGLALGTQWPSTSAPVSARGNSLIASGPLAHSLDTQLASASGDTHILATFRARDGNYCRVFSAPALGGIACRKGATWELRQTRAPTSQGAAVYRQAASPDTALLAIAQDMLAGEPLDQAEEARARARGWK